MPPRVLLIHGSATDHMTWSIQLASPLKDQFELDAYDRRSDATTVEAHAEDALARLPGVPTLLVGSSFGAVVALEVLRRLPPQVAGAVLIEPPMAASDSASAAPLGFVAEYDRRMTEQGGPAAAEFFLRTVLTDALYERMPRAYQERSKARYREIRADTEALIAYRPRYAELGAITRPVLLLAGAHSAPYFRPTLDALAAVLPQARLDVVPGAGHMLHAEAHRAFADRLVAFARETGVL